MKDKIARDVAYAMAVIMYNEALNSTLIVMLDQAWDIAGAFVSKYPPGTDWEAIRTKTGYDW
jgi:hypothetical protein